MRRRSLRHSGNVILAAPAPQRLRRLCTQTFPPDIAVIGESHVREESIVGDRGEGVGIAEAIGAGGDAKEAGLDKKASATLYALANSPLLRSLQFPYLRVDGPETPVRAKTHPANIISHSLDLETTLTNGSANEEQCYLPAR
jgi:hypothetical protein